MGRECYINKIPGITEIAQKKETALFLDKLFKGYIDIAGFIKFGKYS